jgi:pentatricopeptide repeat protein
MVARYPDFEHK